MEMFNIMALYEQKELKIKKNRQTVGKQHIDFIDNFIEFSRKTSSMIPLS